MRACNAGLHHGVYAMQSLSALGRGMRARVDATLTVCEFTPRKSSGEYIHNRQQIHDVADSAESFIGPSIARISHGYRTDVRGMYGGCTGDVREMYG